MRVQFRCNHEKFLKEKKRRNAESAFQALSAMAKERTKRRSMKKLCSFIFLKNLIGKCVRVLRYNAFYQKQKKNVPTQYRNLLKQKAFMQ